MKVFSLIFIAATAANAVLAFKVTYHQSNSSSKKPVKLRYISEMYAVSSSSVETGDQDLSKDLSKENSLNLRCVKNARDLAHVAESPIIPNRVYRTGKLSDATSLDIDILLKQRDIRTVIDLRSPTELKEDEGLHRDEVFGEFLTVKWMEGKRTRFLVGNGHHKHFNGRVQTKGLNSKVVAQHHSSSDKTVSRVAEKPLISNNRKRHFVSLMNEYKYVRGVVRKLRKRDVLKVVLKSPGALFSRRVRKALKNVFLDEINDGGLHLLNELMLRMGAPGIRYCLELISDRENHPILFHCTAGKDRTGIIAALILALVGVPDYAIVQDYTLSANVYAEMNDHTAMVGALSQRNLDPKTFLGAPPQVMQDTLESIRETYGSIEGYCDWIGFGPEMRENLKVALTA